MFFRQTVSEHEVAVRVRHGRTVGLLGPGRHWIGTDALLRVDARPRTVTVPMQEVPTREGLAVRVSLHLEYRVVDAVRALAANADYERAAYAETQLVLRDALGERTVETILTERKAIEAAMTEAAREAFAALGLELIRLAVRDLALPADVRRIATQVELARREGQAALERARGEGAALRSLANSARLLDRNPGLLALRAIQGMERSPGSTVILQGSAENWARLDAPMSGESEG